MHQTLQQEVRDELQWAGGEFLIAVRSHFKWKNRLKAWSHYPVMGWLAGWMIRLKRRQIAERYGEFRSVLFHMNLAGIKGEVFEEELLNAAARIQRKLDAVMTN